MSEDEYHIPNDGGISPSDIHPGADLTGADLSEAHLPEADLSEADLSRANLSEAYLREADLTEANLREADLSEADLYDANLSEANLYDADLSDADLSFADLSDVDLYDADLSDANLRGGNLSGANLIRATLTGALFWNTSLSDVLISRNTVIAPPGQRLEQTAENSDIQWLSNAASRYDAIARANHELRTAYSENGLLSQARNARVRERRARRQEAKSDGTRWGKIEWVGSWLSRYTTGYGVKLLPVLLVMSALFLGSAVVYTLWGGMAFGESLYYSIVTFTTSPPQNPSDVGFGLFATTVAGIETFAGTAAIIFLGYVLGTRERV